MGATGIPHVKYHWEIHWNCNIYSWNISIHCAWIFGCMNIMDTHYYITNNYETIKILMLQGINQ